MVHHYHPTFPCPGCTCVCNGQLLVTGTFAPSHKRLTTVPFPGKPEPYISFHENKGNAMTTKTTQAITELTADGPSDEIDLSAIDRASLYVKHNNGSGTPSTAGSIALEVQGVGSSNWHPVQSLIFSKVAGDVEDGSFPIPDDAGKARLSYYAPSGTTGQTLNADCMKVSYAS